MTKNEVMMVIDTLRKQGYSDEDILECFYNIFADDKITLSGNKKHGTKHNEYICYKCNFACDRDVNAVMNLLTLAK